MARPGATERLLAAKTHSPPQREQFWTAPISDAEFEFIRDLARRHAGIAIADYKRNMVFGRVSKRLRALGLSSMAAYVELLLSPAGEDELQPLINALSTNKTSFFREKHHFEHLAAFLSQTADRPTRAGERRIRIWSAGCSSGEEPYSIAMTAMSGLPDPLQWDLKILATDIDTEMLGRARAGLYPVHQLASVPEPLRERHTRLLRRDPTRFAIAKHVRDRIAFNALNLVGPWPMKGPFDVVFCRNVVIYFDKPTQRLLFDRFAEILPVGGLLYIGHSESLYRVSDRFEIVGQSIYRRAL